MGLAQDVLTNHPNIGEKLTVIGTQTGSATAVGSAATVIFGLPVNLWVTMIVGIGGLIIAIMSYRLNARYKKMHYELEVDRIRKRLWEKEHGREEKECDREQD